MIALQVLLMLVAIAFSALGWAAVRDAWHWRTLNVRRETRAEIISAVLIALGCFAIATCCAVMVARI